MPFKKIFEFERALADLTGAPFVVMTDCCTHAIELCMMYDEISLTSFPAYTYICIPMTMRKLGIAYNMVDTQWTGEYQFENTRIWDSARLLQTGMYRRGQMQCLSFGHGKPLEIGRGGAILLDDETAYKTLSRQRSDGRDLSISPWQDQPVFELGYHYRPTIEEAVKGLEKLPFIDQEPKYIQYPDLRNIIFK